MKDHQTRLALSADLDPIYRMGFDAWAEGASAEEYLAVCRASPKYARGTWYLHTWAEEPVSSLILYRFGPTTIGIGSIATSPERRRQGAASALLRDVLRECDKTLERPACFLYADIEPAFYEGFGFSALPREHQKYQSSVCMLRPGKSGFVVTAERVPTYF